MSLVFLPDGWKRFAAGHRWRCAPPRYLCEIDDPGQAPDYLHVPGTVSNIRRIKAFYDGRLRLGLLDETGTGVDVLTANSLTESFGSVPSPLSTAELRALYREAVGTDPGVKLDHVVRSVGARARFLERREPGYVNPLSTAGRVSLGAHHVLISTALSLAPETARLTGVSREAAIVDLVCRLPAESLYAADFAVRYFNRSHALHFNQPPLLAATYNAGSPRYDPGNSWNLKQYGEHVDRWVRYYNTCRLV
jgi:hypothetical protein